MRRPPRIFLGVWNLEDAVAVEPTLDQSVWAESFNEMFALVAVSRAGSVALAGAWVPAGAAVPERAEERVDDRGVRW